MDVGINFNDRHGVLLDRVFSGVKRYETRRYNPDSPTHGQLCGKLLNKRTGIIRTGVGRASLVGSWTLGEGFLADYDWLIENADDIGNDGTDYDIQRGVRMWVYPIKQAKRYKHPRKIASFGIQFRKIQEEN